jgi:hypothetical protein
MSTIVYFNPEGISVSTLADIFVELASNASSFSASFRHVSNRRFEIVYNNENQYQVSKVYNQVVKNTKLHGPVIEIFYYFWADQPPLRANDVFTPTVEETPDSNSQLPVLSSPILPLLPTLTSSLLDYNASAGRLEENYNVLTLSLPSKLSTIDNYMQGYYDC